VGKQQPDIIDLFNDKTLKNHLKATEEHLSKQRLLYSYELLINQDEEKAHHILKKFKEIAKTFPYSGEVQGEKEFIQLIQGKYQQLGQQVK